MRRSILFNLTLVAMLLAGCAVGPDYTKPKMDVPEAYICQDQEAQNTANTKWWERFNDPVLNELIAESLVRNKNLMIAEANVEQAAAILEATRSPLFPQIGYSGAAARQRLSESGSQLLTDNPQNSFQTFGSVSWEIDLWGRLRRLSEASQANLFATEEVRRGVIISLVSSVANTYMQLLGLDGQLTIAKRSLLIYGESVELFEKQFKGGQVSQMTVEQARTQYETAAAAIPQIELQITQTENALSVLLGRNPGNIQRGRTLDDIMLPAVPSGIPSDILINRPDICAAEENLIAANAKIGAARALYFPTISLTGKYGYVSSDLSELFKSPSQAWNYTGSITGPIFTAGAISGQVKQSEAARMAALYNYESSIQGAFADVENALVARRKIDEQVKAQERLVKASKEYARLAQIQYNGGYAPYSTVLQAQQQLFPAELNYVQSRTSLIVSLVNIYKAMGGGWITEADQMTESSSRK